MLVKNGFAGEALCITTALLADLKLFESDTPLSNEYVE